ncbi:MAG TPA: hypothetical protein VGL83_12060 [Stellaceae bacterium]|jgi:hypothetical protein
MGDIELAAFYREQAARMVTLAGQAVNSAGRLELMEMAATFQRLAMREEELAVSEKGPESPQMESA